MRCATLMVEIVVGSKCWRIFALTALALVGSNFNFKRVSKNIKNHLKLDEKECYSDDDCNGNGYCHQGKCICLPGYNFAQDCSIYSCEYKCSELS